MSAPASIDVSEADLMTADEDALLRVDGLQVHFPGRSGFLGLRRFPIKAVDGVDLTLRPGETLGLVGESGSGKSTTGRAIIRLLEPTGGRVVFDGHSLTDIRHREFQEIRRRFQIVFQDPYSSLNPRMSVREILNEPLVIAKAGTPGSRRRRVDELLELVGLDRSHGARYPHSLSGGQRQRVGIARALALDPKLLILDEPVSALDVSLQAQIVNLLQELQRQLGLAYLFISHDLSVIRQICHRVAIIYLGKIVETGPIDEILSSPSHPYTQALLSAVPIEDPLLRGRRGRIVLGGDAASPSDPPSGCSFHPRCWRARDVCAIDAPPLAQRPGVSHPTACHFAGPRRPDEAGTTAPPTLTEETP